MRIALDTNVLAYAEGFGDAERTDAGARVIEGLHLNELVMPVQVAAELFRLVTHKFRRSNDEAARIVLRWRRSCPLHPESSDVTFESAVDLATRHRLQIFDALILSAAVEASCDLLLSEDMQDGFVWRGVTVANPFAPNVHPLLADALRP